MNQILHRNIGLLGAVASIVTALAAGFTWLSQDIGKAVWLFAVAYVLVLGSACFFAWRPALFANKVRRFLVATRDLRKHLTAQGLREIYETPGNNDRQASDLVCRFLESLRTSFHDIDELRDAVDGASFLLNRTVSQDRYVTSARQLLDVNERLAKLTLADSLDQMLMPDGDGEHRCYEMLPDVLLEIQTGVETFLDKPVNVCLKTIDPEDESRMRCTYSRRANPLRAGNDDKQLTVPKLSIWGHVYDSGRRVIYFSPEDAIVKQFPKGSWHEQDEFAKSGIIVPITVNGESIGVLNIDSSEERTFSSDMVGMFENMAYAFSVMFQLSDYAERVDLIEMETLKPRGKRKGDRRAK